MNDYELGLQELRDGVKDPTTDTAEYRAGWSDGLTQITTETRDAFLAFQFDPEHTAFNNGYRDYDNVDIPWPELPGPYYDGFAAAEAEAVDHITRQNITADNTYDLRSGEDY